MTVKRVTTRNGDPGRMFRSRTPFTTSGALSGRFCDYCPGTGRMPEAMAEVMREDFRKFGRMFVVFSYGTPIAWARPDGSEVIPAVRYSVTTSRHQSALR
jgi:hypothetical protein